MKLHSNRKSGQRDISWETSNGAFERYMQRVRDEVTYPKSRTPSDMDDIEDTGDTDETTLLYHSVSDSHPKPKRTAPSLLGEDEGRLYTRIVGVNFRHYLHNKQKLIERLLHFLNCAISEGVMFNLLMQFHQDHSQALKCSREEFEALCRSHLGKVQTNFLVSLTVNEKRIYQKLDASQKEAMRICRGLAYHPQRQTPQHFHLSCRQLKIRLNLSHDQKAHDILKSFEGKIIRLVKKGDRYSADCPKKKRQASVYEYLLR